MAAHGEKPLDVKGSSPRSFILSAVVVAVVIVALLVWQPWNSNGFLPGK